MPGFGPRNVEYGRLHRHKHTHVITPGHDRDTVENKNLSDDRNKRFSYGRAELGSQVSIIEDCLAFVETSSKKGLSYVHAVRRSRLTSFHSHEKGRSFLLQLRIKLAIKIVLGCILPAQCHIFRKRSHLT